MVSGIENDECSLHMSISWKQSTLLTFLQIFFKENTKKFLSNCVEKHKTFLSIKPDSVKKTGTRFFIQVWRLTSSMLLSARIRACTSPSYMPCWMSLVKINEIVHMEEVKARWRLESDFCLLTFISFAGQSRQVYFLIWISSKWFPQQEEERAREVRDHSLEGFVNHLSRIYY